MPSILYTLIFWVGFFKLYIFSVLATISFSQFPSWNKRQQPEACSEDLSWEGGQKWGLHLPLQLGDRLHYPSGHTASPTCLLRLLPAREALNAPLCPSNMHSLSLTSYPCLTFGIGAPESRGADLMGKYQTLVFISNPFFLQEILTTSNMKMVMFLHSLLCPKKFHIGFWKQWVFPFFVCCSESLKTAYQNNRQEWMLYRETQAGP